ncbi:hypothetical protein PR048_010242 [Dryococelus australis]|uniref:Uncharacterized protein n=1 Tax=Dryococelus australis TaxID=614101 RepID=A0ABQ9I281_9NEOP|nr:hypothetical protein PR048_010242 [Dryococelus australis]
MPLASGCSRGTPVSPALAFQRYSILKSHLMSCPGMAGTYGSELESPFLKKFAESAGIGLQPSICIAEIDGRQGTSHMRDMRTGNLFQRNRGMISRHPGYISAILPLTYEGRATISATKSRPMLDSPGRGRQFGSSGAGMKGLGKREIPEKTRRPTISSGTIQTCENPVTQPGIESGSPWWEKLGLGCLQNTATRAKPYVPFRFRLRPMLILTSTGVKTLFPNQAIPPTSPRNKELVQNFSRSIPRVKWTLASKVKKGGRDTGDTNTHKCLIAPTRKACSKLCCIFIDQHQTRLTAAVYRVCLNYCNKRRDVIRGIKTNSYIELQGFHILVTRITITTSCVVTFGLETNAPPLESTTTQEFTRLARERERESVIKKELTRSHTLASPPRGRTSRHQTRLWPPSEVLFWQVMHNGTLYITTGPCKTTGNWDTSLAPEPQNKEPPPKRRKAFDRRNEDARRWSIPTTFIRLQSSAFGAMIHVATVRLERPVSELYRHIRCYARTMLCHDAVIRGWEGRVVRLSAKAGFTRCKMSAKLARDADIAR